MKHFKTFLAALALTLGAGAASAQVPGKVYAVGDTIIIDNIWSWVISVDESGEHGLAFSAPSVEGTLGPVVKFFRGYRRSYFARELKEDGVSKQEAKALAVELEEQMKEHSFRGISLFGKKEKNFTEDQFRESLPEGWRMLTMEDIETIERLILKHDKWYNYDWLPNPISRRYAQETFFNGVVVWVDDKYQCYNCRPGALGKHHRRYLKSEMRGNERSVAAKNF